MRLAKFYGERGIARRVHLTRKIVARVLCEEGVTKPDPDGTKEKKLEPFLEQVEERVKKRLRTTRILREIRELGYKGGRTILAEHVRNLRSRLTLAPRRNVKCRFETSPGKEMQIDWSPYHVPIAGRTVTVHALGALLASSRKLSLRFYPNERQSTLLEGLTAAFRDFDGVALRVVLDNMATAVLGRIGPDRKPVWHPRFLDFARHYGFEPFACAVRDPDRKGKKEKSFRLVEDDFLNGSEFASWEDLDRRCRIWLDETPKVANLRVHGTTGCVPNEAFLDEHPCLIRLPESRFPVHDEEIRSVDRDSTLWVRGTPYTVPSSLANHSVVLRLFSDHFEVQNPLGQIAFSRRYVPDAEKGRLVIDPTHYAPIARTRRANEGGAQRLDEAFVRRFPTLSDLVDGLKRRMKTLAPIHIRALIRLADRYGEPAFLAAATRAQEFRRFDAFAVERILDRTCPPPDEPIPPTSGRGPFALGDVDPGSLDSYDSLDTAPPAAAAGPDGQPEPDSHTETDPDMVPGPEMKTDAEMKPGLEKMRLEPEKDPQPTQDPEEDVHGS